MMTLQEIFDVVYKHLVYQGARAEAKIKNRENVPICAYRTPDGKKCAAGVLIKSEFYDPEFEGLTVVESDVKNALVKSGVDVDEDKIFRLVSELQHVHDHVKVALWGVELACVAENYNLVVPEV